MTDPDFTEPKAHAKTRHELRCFCRIRPMLAMYGLDERGKLYIHIKVYKAGKIFGEVVIEEGSVVKLRCRECYRWHRVRIVQKDRAVLEELRDPPITENP